MCHGIFSAALLNQPFGTPAWLSNLESVLYKNSDNRVFLNPVFKNSNALFPHTFLGAKLKRNLR